MDTQTYSKQVAVAFILANQSKSAKTSWGIFPFFESFGNHVRTGLTKKGST